MRVLELSLLDELTDLVETSLDKAMPSALGLREGREKLAKAMLADHPQFQGLQLAQATKVWAAIVYVDMRESTKRALNVGAQATYLTMHALLPMLAHLIGRDGKGYVVGYRGDGMFGAFGIDRHAERDFRVDQATAVQNAGVCGARMVEAVQRVVNPVLEKRGVPADIEIGVGVDAGDVVVTRIGLPGAFDVTTYGDAVNAAAKLCNVARNSVRISDTANSIYPSSAGGRVREEPEELGYTLSFPPLLD